MLTLMVPTIVITLAALAVSRLAHARREESARSLVPARLRRDRPR